jgi:hypothetical protein
MPHITKINCTIGTSNGTVPLGLEIWLDNVCVLNIDSVTHEQDFETTCSDDDAEHDLKFILKNKKPEHTTVSSTGEIITDAVLYIKDIKFENIDVGQFVFDSATYTHDFNGSGSTVQEQFYGTMGCNGTVALKFSTPVYLWILEHM